MAETVNLEAEFNSVQEPIKKSGEKEPTPELQRKQDEIDFYTDIVKKTKLIIVLNILLIIAIIIVEILIEDNLMSIWNFLIAGLSLFMLGVSISDIRHYKWKIKFLELEYAGLRISHIFDKLKGKEKEK